jgi:hypothetical protein
MLNCGWIPPLFDVSPALHADPEYRDGLARFADSMARISSPAGQLLQVELQPLSADEHNREHDQPEGVRAVEAKVLSLGGVADHRHILIQFLPPLHRHLGR